MHVAETAADESNVAKELFDPRNGLRGFLVIDGVVRLLIWSNAIVLAIIVFTALDAWPEGDPVTEDLGSAWRWGTCLCLWVVLYNVIYVAELVVLRLLVPTPREGRYPIGPGRKLERQVLWSCLVAVLTKARLEAPFPGFLVFHIANLPPMCWVMGPVFGPKSRSCYTTEPLVIDPHLVQIGRNVVVGLNTVIAGHHMERDAVVFKRTVIEDDAVIGGRVSILGGVHIRRGAVISAGSVLLPNTVVGANELWWGVPARRIRQVSFLDGETSEPSSPEGSPSSSSREPNSAVGTSETVRMIRSFLSPDGAMQHISDNDELLSTGLLDSAGVLGLTAKLEESFGLQIGTEHLTEENFGSVRRIADLVDRLLVERDTH